MIRLEVLKVGFLVELQRGDGARVHRIDIGRGGIAKLEGEGGEEGLGLLQEDGWVEGLLGVEVGDDDGEDLGTGAVEIGPGGGAVRAVVEEVERGGGGVDLEEAEGLDGLGDADEALAHGQGDGAQLRGV